MRNLLFLNLFLMLFFPWKLFPQYEFFASWEGSELTSSSFVLAKFDPTHSIRLDHYLGSRGGWWCPRIRWGNFRMGILEMRGGPFSLRDQRGLLSNHQPFFRLRESFISPRGEALDLSWTEENFRVWLQGRKDRISLGTDVLYSRDGFFLGWGAFYRDGPLASPKPFLRKDPRSLLSYLSMGVEFGSVEGALSYFIEPSDHEFPWWFQGRLIMELNGKYILSGGIGRHARWTTGATTSDVMSRGEILWEKSWSAFFIKVGAGFLGTQIPWDLPFWERKFEIQFGWEEEFFEVKLFYDNQLEILGNNHKAFFSQPGEHEIRGIMKLSLENFRFGAQWRSLIQDLPGSLKLSLEYDSDWGGLKIWWRSDEIGIIQGKFYLNWQKDSQVFLRSQWDAETGGWSWSAGASLGQIQEESG